MRSLLAFALLAVSALALGEWTAPNMYVPIARLLENLTVELKKKPNDAHVNYLLGRLHSMAFAGETKPGLFGTPSDPQFPVYTSVKVKRAKPTVKLTSEELDHLLRSIRFYDAAVRLEPNNGLFQLGFAWMNEEAAPSAGQIGNETPQRFRDRALSVYRRLYAANVDRDLKGRSHLIGAEDVFVSEDAGAGILRLAGQTLPASEKKQIEANVKTLSLKVSGITPIIFSTSGRRGLSDLLDPEAKVAFDLVGDGGKREWSWVRPDTGILVWDPQGTGRISSGRQLFGSVTFWLFFTDGYAALSSLDDNHDGWLTGRELKGIGVWQDRNGNGVADPGEVQPVASLGIAAIRTKASPDGSGVLAAQDGIRFRNGSTVATYDWIPAMK